MNKRFFLVLFTALALTGRPVLAIDPIPADSRDVVLLNGKWRFKLEQAPPPPRFLGTTGRPIPIITPPTMEEFFRPDYREDSKWHNLAVPGNWEMAGFSPATYNNPDNASGFYRLKFHVPSRWKGRLVKINFDGVQNGCEIWCNGQPVPVDGCSWGRTNYHESGWTAWQADLTGAVKFGAENLLALHVTKNTKSVDCDSGDFFFLGGVYRPVTLFSVPSSHLAEVAVRTKLLPDDQAELTVVAKVAEAQAGATVSMQLDGEERVQGAVAGDGRVTLSQVVPHPRLWSAEFPNLYPLSVDLQDSTGAPLEHWSHKIGIREVSIRNGIFCVNNTPVKLVGICRHDVYPTLGTAIDEAVWRKDIMLMKAANFNAIRTSHYPYGSGFYDLCDELGMYVADEEPFCWVDCSDTNLTPAFAQRSRETVLRDRTHPCVVLWAIGNENKAATNNNLAANITRELDPTRPRLVSCQKADANGANVEFDDEHYVTPERIHKDETSPRRAKWPQIYLENPNNWEVRNGPDYGSLDLWGAVIQRTWNELWYDDHVTGTFHWEWQDRAVADKCPTKYYDYFPKTGLELMKVKGLVDGFRNPRPNYYHCKMAQTPVALDTNAEVLPDGVVLTVTNRYSFTDLRDLKAEWRLLRGNSTVGSGKAVIELGPRSHGTAHLDLPAKSMAKADTLQMTFNHPGGWNVVTYAFPLKKIMHPPPAVAMPGDTKFPRFNLLTGKVMDEKKGWKRLHRQTGELANIRLKKKGQEAITIDAATLYATPLKDVESMEADVRLAPGTNTVGRVRARYNDGKFNYTVRWRSESSTMFELGWIVRGPVGADRFSWDRKAVWSYYPAGFIGRADGLATPDSMNVDLTKVDRPDAFDFGSTKFNCHWAALTDRHSRGLSLSFPKNELGHVRAEVESNGTCGLVVNRCYSPPRDISTSLVPDLYTTLKKGDQVTGNFWFVDPARETRE